MSLSGDLDAWLAVLATAAGVAATRDPGMIHPPCVFMDSPDAARGTLPALDLEVSLWLLDQSPTQAHRDATLNKLHAVMNAAGAHDATRSTLTVGGQEHFGYRITAKLTTTE